MKPFILTILLFFILTGQSQLTEPLIGTDFSTAKKESFSGFIGENTTTLFTADYLYINRKKQELNIRKFHKSDLQLIETINIYEDVMEDYYNEPIEIFFQANRFYLFSNYFGEKDKLKLLSIEVFDEHMEKLSFAIIDTIEMDETIEIQESKEHEGFLIVRYSKYSTLREQEINLKMIDNNGEIEWTNIIKSPLALQNLNVEKVRYGKNTPIYILCNYSFFSGSKPIGEDEDLINNKYAIWAYDRENNFLKEFEVRMMNKWINGIQMTLSKTDELILSGYINETRHHTIKGIFSLLINQMEVKNSAITLFDEDILYKFIEEKDRKRLNEMEDYKLNHLAILNDGSYFLIGEQYYKYVERTYDPRTNITTTVEHYSYNSIIISYFDNAGNHVWTDCIPKQQNSTNDYGFYSSYSLMNTGEKLYLFFNDNEKNNELALHDYFNYNSLFNNRKFQISFVEVGQKAIMKRGILLDDRNNYMLRAKSSSQINKSKMYLLTENGRQARIVSVGLED